MKNKKALSGADAAALAMKQINPDVCAVYPITPQTPIMMKFSEYVADGEVDTELIRVESEHSAMSACVGSSAAGARTMSATSANGLALMFEIVYIAASLRLPIVMNLANRALSGPINIHCDHSDSMGVRDSGWIQLYAENCQEVYDDTIIAMRIAEHKDVLLPVMCCQDGFITSHGVETVETLDDKKIKDFVGQYKPAHSLLNLGKPMTVGPIDFYDYYFEHKRQQIEAMEKAKSVIKKIFDEYAKISGRKYGFVEAYHLDDAERIIVAMNSACGTIKHVVNLLRAKGEKVGLLKLRVFRPFMHNEIIKNLENAKSVAVLDRAASFGAYGGPVFNEIRNSFYDNKKKPEIISYIYGLGGREFTVEQVEQVFSELKGDLALKTRMLGVRE
jgi:pyruvate ferredoxin oxidoreductase alpha subunit